MKKKSTLGNKILAVCLLVLSAITMIIEKEATGFLFVCMVAIPLFFAKRNYIYIWKGPHGLFLFLREIYICFNGNNNKIKEILL